MSNIDSLVKQVHYGHCLCLHLACFWHRICSHLQQQQQSTSSTSTQINRQYPSSKKILCNTEYTTKTTSPNVQLSIKTCVKVWRWWWQWCGNWPVRNRFRGFWRKAWGRSNPDSALYAICGTREVFSENTDWKKKKKWVEPTETYTVFFLCTSLSIQVAHSFFWRWIVYAPVYNSLATWVPAGSPSCGGDVVVYAWHKQTQLAHFFLFCSRVYVRLYGPFNCISFHKFSRQLSTFSLCSSSLISALLVLSAIYLSMKVSFSPDIIHCGCLGLKHQLTK